MNEIVDQYMPIRKVIAGFIASLIVYLAHRFLSLDLGSQETAEAIIPAVGLLVAYAARDARVRGALALAEKAIEHKDDAPATPAA